MESQQDSAGSKKKIKPFIENYSINMDEFLPEEGRNESDPYSSFNQFFIRRFKEGKETFLILVLILVLLVRRDILPTIN